MTTRLLLWVTTCLTLCSAAAAQQPTEPTEVKNRNDCRLATQVLTHGQPANKRDWAFQIIAACPQAPAVIEHLWNNLPTKGAEIEGLFHLSRQVRDGRIYEAVYRIAADPTYRSLVRVVALGVLGSYVVPDLHMHPEFAELDGLESIGVRYNNIWTNIDHWVQREGDTPLPPDAEPRILALVAELADPDGAEPRDPKLYSAAWWLDRRLRAASPGRK